MSGFWDASLGGNKNQLANFLGPDYNYIKKIKTPSQMGMSSAGSLSQLGTNIGGLINYAQLLSQGGGGAQNAPGPLGPAFFLETGAKCSDVKSGDQVTRSIYFNGIPTGQIPFISNVMGANFSEFLGIVPGALQNVGQINPLAMFSAFSQGSSPPCREVTLLVRNDENNQNSMGTAFVSDADISNIDPCWFKGGKNPLGNSQFGCPTGNGYQTGYLTEGFSNFNQENSIDKNPFLAMIKKEQQGISDQQVLSNLENIIWVTIILSLIMLLLKCKEFFNQTDFLTSFMNIFKKTKSKKK